jgi:hypothetical protein
MRSIIRLGLFTLLAANTFGCSERKIFQSSAGSESSSIEANLESSQGMKTAEQLLMSFSALTGIPASNNSVNNVFVDVKSQLPYENAMSSFQASGQMAILKLAAEFCRQLSSDATRRSELAPGLNFSTAPGSAYTPEARAAMVQAMMTKFWGEGLSNSPDRNDALSTYDELIVSLLPDAPESTTANNNGGTASVFAAVCTAVLATATTGFQ